MCRECLIRSKHAMLRTGSLGLDRCSLKNLRRGRENTFHLLVNGVDAAGLQSGELGSKSYFEARHTSLPLCTHLVHGRLVSQAKCFFLQLTQAEGTCAFALRAIPGGPGTSCASVDSCALDESSSTQSDELLVLVLPGRLEAMEVSVLLGVLSSLLQSLDKALLAQTAPAVGLRLLDCTW